MYPENIIYEVDATVLSLCENISQEDFETVLRNATARIESNKVHEVIELIRGGISFDDIPEQYTDTAWRVVNAVRYSSGFAKLVMEKGKDVLNIPAHYLPYASEPMRRNMCRINHTCYRNTHNRITVGVLTNITEEQFLSMRNVGNETVNETRKLLKQLGLSFKPN